MIFSLEHLLQSIGQVLAERYPSYPIYTSPTQQGTEIPCFFIFVMQPQVIGEIDERFQRDIGLDIVFLQQRNVPDGNEKNHEVAEFLDDRLELFNYSDGTGDSILRTYERQWHIENGDLHYQFHVKARLSVPRQKNPIQSLEENHVKVK